MRAVSVCAFAVLASLLATAAIAQDRVIFIVRHAERADAPAPTQSTHSMIGNDVPLSAAGQARAQKLAQVLRSAGIKHVFTTEFQRTRQTAAPLAQQEKLKPVMAPAKDIGVLVQELRQIKEPTLVVGHADTVPQIAKKLGVVADITIADNEYDNLFVVVRPVTGKPTLIRLRY
jgi:phosphohistidine phosphatase SixA